MEQSQLTKKIITLIGRLETPIITPKPFMRKKKCQIKIVREPLEEKRPTYAPLGKLTKGERKAPNVLNGFRGFVKITSVGESVVILRKRIENFMQKRFLGQYTREGFGRVVWINCSIANYEPKPTIKRKKLKIRKGLGCNYPKPLQRLLITLMLHDFVHTKMHPSKIYHQITIEDDEIREACLNHHNKEMKENQLIKIIRRYDSLASWITRRKPLKAITRYDYDNGEIDFKQLTEEIEKRSHSAYKLYSFIYQSDELKRVVEALDYKKSSLRTHLLLMVNLAINEYYMGTLKIVNDRINIKEISESARKKRNLKSAKGAEKHLIIPLMSNANSENATSSMNEKARNIEREKTEKY